MRTDIESERSGQGIDEAEDVHRGGLLQQHEQRPLGDSEDIRVKLLVALVTAAIRQSPSSSLWHLSLLQAQRAVGATDEETAIFWEGIQAEMEKSWWPKGFFDDGT
jgi:hypothetical protein